MMQAGKAAVRVEQLWQELFAGPSLWWDNRLIKENPKYPDFKHKITHEGLWIEGWFNPPWVKAKVATMDFSQPQPDCRLKSSGQNVRQQCEQGKLKEALDMVELMVQQNVHVPINSFACLLKLCTERKALLEGKRVHALLTQTGLDSNILLGGTLINMYAKCGSVSDAWRVFDLMPERNVFSWTTIISAYANNQQSKQALNLFQQMKLAGIPPNRVAFIVALKACASILALEQGKKLHLDIIKSGLESEVTVASTLIDMYSKCGCINDARRLFDNTNDKDVVSWNSMIAGYAQQGLAEEALNLYHQMKQGGMQPTYVTFVLLLKACANIGALAQGMQIHSDIIRNGLDSDLTAGNTLVDMYAKCGRIDDALKVLNNMPKRDVVSWNAMITGYSQQGLGNEALAIFEQMQKEGIKPNEVTYISLLSACSHSGKVDRGLYLFNSMCKDQTLVQTMEHYACMVDLLCRAGCLVSAKNFIRKMPIQPNSVIWMTLLGAAQNCGDVEIGRHAFDAIVKLEPDNAAAYVILSNIYVRAGQRSKVAHIRKKIDNADA